MNEIIAIKGIGKIGKTETIKIVYDLLISKYPKAILINQKINSDIRYIIIINGVKIGIESQGDPNSRLFQSIPLFVKNKCKIIICATRSRGNTVKLIKKQEEKYSITWHEKKGEIGKEKQKEANSKMANTIMKKTTNLINTYCK